MKRTARVEKRAAKKAEAQARKAAEKAKMDEKAAAAAKRAAVDEAIHAEKGAQWETMVSLFLFSYGQLI